MAATQPAAAPATPRNSLIRLLVAALLAVAALPFAVVGYQTWVARESLVVQAQQTHLIAARATADRVATQLEALRNLASGSAQNPLLYEQPNSDAAREVLAGLLVGQTRLLAAATFFHEGDNPDRMVQLARPEQGEPVPVERLRELGRSPELFSLAGAPVLGVSADTGRPGLRLALLASAAPIADALQAQELGDSAELYLLRGESIDPTLAPSSDLLTTLPDELLEAVRMRSVDARAVRTEHRGRLAIGAFARVGDTDWAVASLQPAAHAESAASSMQRAALLALLAVSALVGVFGTAAWRVVVRPLRSLLSLQRSVLQTESGGGDLADLKTAFAQIQQYQKNREALKEVFLGRYKVLSTLGQGAMGSVFLAWDPRLRRHVAIKTIHLEALDEKLQAALAKTLENEAVAVANLQHPNIVGVYDLVAVGQFAFVVMEYVEGGNLRTVISRNGALSPAEVALIAQSMLKALDVAHRAGLLHLDIKPGNVLVPPKGELKLTDFGVSAWRFEVPDLVARGGLAGTPGFIAPEYVNGGAPTERSDLYSLGMLLVEALTGAAQHLPGARTGDLRRAAQKAVELPPRLQQSAPALCAAVLKLCALNPAQRPASAAEALTLFEALDLDAAAEQLAQRARDLADESLLDEVDQTHTGGRAPGGDRTRPAPGADTTRPPPSAADVTRPPPSRSEAVTLPPPSADTTLRLPQEPDATRPPPRR